MENESVIDSRIKQELECLNTTSLKINDLENKINEKRSQYRTALSASTQRLNALAQKLGDCISKARPYYEAKRVAKQAHNEAQQAAIHFERAASMHTAAREMVTVAEKGMGNDSHDTAWADMLNHAIARVNEAEADRFRSEKEHLKRAEAFKSAEERVKKLQKSLKSSIRKSQPYFEMKKVTQDSLETISTAVNKVEEELKKLKELYSTTLQNLEEISDSIHASRALESLAENQSSVSLGQRQDGVGAETPFNEQEIVTDLSLKLEQSTSQLAVLNDLCETDSIDRLSSLNESSSLDVVSYTSSISQNSSASASVTSEKTSNRDKHEVDIIKDVSESSFSSDAATTTSSGISTSSLSVDTTAFDQSKNNFQIPTCKALVANKKNEESKDNKKLTLKETSNFIFSSTEQSTNTAIAARRSAPKNKELLLSIAGLGQVSTEK